MTILVLANSSVGVYNFRNELMKRLSDRHEMFISVPDAQRKRELEEEGCKVICTPINKRGMNPIEDFRLFLKYRGLMKRIRPDVVLTYTIKPNIYGGICCRLRKIPYIITITGLGTNFQKKGLIRHLITVMYRVAAKKAACIFFQNMQNQQTFADYKIHGKKSILVKGSGVDLKQHVFETYSADGPVRFLFVGRIMKEKGIEEFLRAADILYGEYGDKVEFQTLGADNEDYENILSVYTEKNIITHLGFQLDVHSYMKAASVIVLPTYHEGMSNVLMEASAAGRPVIATNISGCREIFDEGVTGFGCEPGNVESLVEAMRKFLAVSWEERALMGKRAREKMEREFDRTQVTDVYIKEIEGILQSR